MCFLFLLACEKEGKKISGVSTIDSTIYGETTYYVYGFSFAEGGILSWELGGDGPAIDLVILAQLSDGIITGLFDSPEINNPFSLEGEYESPEAAEDAFEALAVVPGGSAYVGLANPLKENQIWVYKSASYYGKIRIMELQTENRDGTPWVSCTFEWAWQPDGSTLFP